MMITRKYKYKIHANNKKWQKWEENKKGPKLTQPTNTDNIKKTYNNNK